MWKNETVCFYSTFLAQGISGKIGNEHDSQYNKQIPDKRGNATQC